MPIGWICIPKSHTTDMRVMSLPPLQSSWNYLKVKLVVVVQVFSFSFDLLCERSHQTLVPLSSGAVTFSSASIRFYLPFQSLLTASVYYQHIFHLTYGPIMQNIQIGLNKGCPLMQGHCPCSWRATNSAQSFHREAPQSKPPNCLLKTAYVRTDLAILDSYGCWWANPITFIGRVVTYIVLRKLIDIHVEKKSWKGLTKTVTRLFNALQNDSHLAS